MKPIYFILAVLASVTIIAMSTQQIYAPRDCGQCAAFKKLTTQFEKDVIDAASVNPPEPDRIQTLLDQYNDDVMELFRTPSTSP
jgi:arsenate reductase-like glutaredoxin family protein